MYNKVIILLYLFIVVSGEEAQIFTSKTLFRKSSANFLEFQNYTYYFNVEYEINFYGALQYCKLRNMELINIDSAIENDKIGLHIIEKGWAPKKFWTSAVNMVAGGKWIWLSNGQPIKYFNWDRGEPTGFLPFVASYENCIQVRHEGTRGFTWNDLNCGVKNYVICKRPSSCSCTNIKGY
ncbi:unnamed protein product [Diabrotica balteata]|uniref:C-type lectin domain-containing protein n=1 Tax=Diabrotica balteata TaxID=107213 RepID=A0A9N9TDH2_DIABA|nr:unnamed protein product [Diabrotica balteata]